MLRLMIAAPLALLLSILLFYTLAMLSGIGVQVAPTKNLAPDLNFLMLRQESQLEIRKRELPPEPEDIVPEKKPDMPQLQQEVTPTVNAPLPSIDVPNIEVGVQVALSPSLNNLTMPVPEIVLDTNPTAISQVPPQYPRRALRKRIEGKVTVEFMVTEAGTVQSGTIKVIQSTPPGVFDAAVMRSIQRWRFKSRVVDGKAVPFRARQVLEFELEK